jgi:putative FmdB family regulatory protein
MPIYEYRCERCGHQQEFLQKVSDAPLTVCTKCGEASFTKMVTAAGFQLKGSGWYATDFKNSGKPAAKSDDAAKSDTGASGDSKPGGEKKPGGESKGDAEKKAAPSSSVGGPAASS